jgi:hypothetical protein
MILIQAQQVAFILKIRPQQCNTNGNQCKGKEVEISAW